MTTAPGFFRRWAVRIEATLLSVILLGMLGATLTQIILRNVSGTALPTVDPLVRASVLWLGLIGAVAAAREFRHIRIDLIVRVLPTVPARILDSIVSLVTAGVCGLVAWHGGRMVIDERTYGGAVAADFPAWVLQTIIPVGFGLMALAYLGHTVMRAIGRDDP